MSLTDQDREAIGYGHAIACHYKCTGSCSTDICICRTKDKWAAVEGIVARQVGAALEGAAPNELRIAALGHAIKVYVLRHWLGALERSRSGMTRVHVIRTMEDS